MIDDERNEYASEQIWNSPPEDIAFGPTTTDLRALLLYWDTMLWPFQKVHLQISKTSRLWHTVDNVFSKHQTQNPEYGMGFYLRNCRREQLHIAVFQVGYSITVHASSLWGRFQLFAPTLDQNKDEILKFLCPEEGERRRSSIIDITSARVAIEYWLVKGQLPLCVVPYAEQIRP